MISMVQVSHGESVDFFAKLTRKQSFHSFYGLLESLPATLSGLFDKMYFKHLAYSSTLNAVAFSSPDMRQFELVSYPSN